MRAWAQRHQELIEQRIDHLVDQVIEGGVDWLPEHLGRPASDEVAEQHWAAAVRTVAAYRDQYAITGPDPLGPAPELERLRAANSENSAAQRLRAYTAQNSSRQPETGGDSVQERLVQAREGLHQRRGGKWSQSSPGQQPPRGGPQI
ncbi:hypothetical protein PU560_11285 [Georgenia sp. 10Sc9-8]|uniref:Uncharacterized protein n=1 Tax=Georgenia halotolerans TaxID=3028317 RepID=A0ABT5TYA5_9MICO|nr:hypothetical protein [Georgenia halotolerans]